MIVTIQSGIQWERVSTLMLLRNFAITVPAYFLAPNGAWQAITRYTVGTDDMHTYRS